jgi:hypothetical protein
LEGYWNFIYFGYKRFEEIPKAVGYVYFSNTNDVKRVEMNNVRHYLLRDYMRIVVGSKEFSYMPFQGRLYDLRVLLGPSAYVETGEDLIKTTLVGFRS